MSELHDRLQQRRREQAELENKLGDISPRLAFGRARISVSILRLFTSRPSELIATGRDEARGLIGSVVERAELVEGKMKIHYAPEAVMDLFLLNP